MCNKFVTFVVYMTAKEALIKVFSDEKKNTDSSFRMWKSRFKNNKLSVEKQEEILKNNGFVKTKETAWKQLK